ncbi:MAG TPA: C69 family dipeptidase [Candidatus Aminicenantes bacterium]|nr:C69 family dipeptidase [Candidatus Aminicenantes bacterium]
MNARRLNALLLAAALLSPALSAATRDGRHFDCYTILVGKAASADGSVLLAHNEDDWGDNIVNVRRIPPHDYGRERNVALGRGAHYRTDGRTAGFLWIEVAPQEYSDSFVNEHGVVLVSDSCPTRETESDLTDGGIGYMLRRIIAEKARTAREAVALAGALIEQFGYRDSGRTYAVADGNEAWLVAAVRGRRWVAQRVPDDEVAILPNHMTIRRVDLGDSARFQGSADLVSYAEAHGWYNPEKDGLFDFKNAYTRPSTDFLADHNTLRHWRGLELLTGREWPIGEDYPFSVKPAEKVTVERLMAILRDHHEGTPYDATDGYKTGSPNRAKFRTICTATTVTSLIASLDASRPGPLAASLWLTLGKPDTTVFLPLYGAGGSLPAGFGLGPQTHDDESFYRQHFEAAGFKAARGMLLNARILAVEKAVEADYGAKIEAVRKGIEALERSFLDGRRAFEAALSAQYAENKAEALKSVDDYVAAAFDRAAEMTEKLAETLGLPSAPSHENLTLNSGRGGTLPRGSQAPPSALR